MTEPLTRDQRVRLYVRLLLRALLITAAFVLLKTAGPWLLSLLAPILVAFFAAMLLNPLVSALHKRLKMPRRLTSILIVLLTLAALSAAVYWIVIGLISQITSLAGNAQGILEGLESALVTLADRLSPLRDALPEAAERLLSDFTATLLSWLQIALGNAADYILANSIDITARVGGWFIAAFVFVVGTYYMTAEYPDIRQRLYKQAGKPLEGPVHILNKALKSAFGGYIRAQFLLALLAFVFTGIPLTLSGQRYALLIAFLLGVVDFLPIIGAIAVLLPWGGYCLLVGDVGQGMFLIILGVAFFLIRRVLEPKIVGSHTGLSPFLALVGIYLGMRLAGLLGAIFGPAALILLISLSREGLLDSAKQDLLSAFRDVRALFWKGGPGPDADVP
ncbi:MAG: sporulation integral membrane protein YtvI [Oscillospiraceae bacterium]|nr:sporulation integral membrane protein YtvI [Oscillospiraceae bacterium]